jgi:hypothetical protein
VARRKGSDTLDRGPQGLHALTPVLNPPSALGNSFDRGLGTNCGHLHSENKHGPPVGSLWMNSEW